MLIDDFTMIIPTYNRPRMFADALRLYSTSEKAYRIIVLDSSADEIQERNAAAIASCRTPITHVRFDAGTTFQTKVGALDGLLETPYVMYMSDDDLAILSGIEESLQFLRVNPDYVACHGIYYRCLLETDRLRIDTEYVTAPIDFATPVERILALMLRYQSIAYTVQRRETLLAARPPVAAHADHFWELFNACRILIAGKVGALATPYMVRNTQLGFRREFLGDGNNLLLHDTTFLAQTFASFRGALAPCLAPHVRKRDAAHIIDLAYAIFLTRYLSFRYIALSLESDGDIGPGAAIALEAYAGRPNSGAPLPNQEVKSVLTDLAVRGWPIFG